ncbi:hypothetical protein BG07_3206 [Bacillus pseudomycoides]|jgi:hypothetical protein|nr:hypothetical protein DJ92_1730 [Bacillus pseudomycoides]AJI17579.1 hypothetical protein BG07_3206 [Bacillus pseudomycoides]KFN16561.1 hypothetical protein DJ94_760 [Bacillus pseudomycoides]
MCVTELFLDIVQFCIVRNNFKYIQDKTEFF